MRQRGARTRTQRAVNKCPFSPSPPLSRALLPVSSSLSLCPAHARSWPRRCPDGVGGRLRPASGALSPAALGSRRPPGQGPLCSLRGEHQAPRLGWQDGGRFGSQHHPSRVQSNCPVRLGPLRGRWTRAGASWALAGPESEALGRQQLKDQVSGKQKLGASGLFCTQSRPWGATCVNPGRRAGGSDTHYKRLGTAPQPWTRVVGQERPAQVQ